MADIVGEKFLLEEYKALQAEILQRNGYAYIAGFASVGAIWTLLAVTAPPLIQSLLLKPSASPEEKFATEVGIVLVAIATLLVIAFFIWVFRMILNDTIKASRRLKAIEAYVREKNPESDSKYTSKFPISWQTDSGIEVRPITRWFNWLLPEATKVPKPVTSDSQKRDGAKGEDAKEGTKPAGY